jgi:UrcA family protein
MNRLNLAIVLSAALICDASAKAEPAVSAADQITETRIVTYADLDLDSSAGAETLYGRIRAAARSVCRAVNGTQPLQLAANRQCARNALAGAVAKVDNHHLTAHHSQMTGNDGVQRVTARL